MIIKLYFNGADEKVYYCILYCSLVKSEQMFIIKNSMALKLLTRALNVIMFLVTNWFLWYCEQAFLKIKSINLWLMMVYDHACKRYKNKIIMQKMLAQIDFYKKKQCMNLNCLRQFPMKKRHSMRQFPMKKLHGMRQAPFNKCIAW